MSAYEASQICGADALDVVKAGGIGAAAGSLGTGAGIIAGAGATAISGNPIAGVVAGGAVGGATASSIEDALSGDVSLGEGARNAGVSAAIGGLTGPAGKAAVPIKKGTFMPDLYNPNGAMSKGLGPNSRKLIGQETYSNAYGGIGRAAYNNARGGACGC